MDSHSIPTSRRCFDFPPAIMALGLVPTGETVQFRVSKVVSSMRRGEKLTEAEKHNAVNAVSNQSME